MALVSMIMGIGMNMGFDMMRAGIASVGNHIRFWGGF